MTTGHPAARVHVGRMSKAGRGTSASESLFGRRPEVPNDANKGQPVRALRHH
jgi:hypothetical protein